MERKYFFILSGEVLNLEILRKFSFTGTIETAETNPEKLFIKLKGKFLKQKDFNQNMELFVVFYNIEEVKY
ncbi:hypothetical protein HOD29_04965 [archaeon]|jgi:hypothetical protein|nr:hypothetical protein [archaeon]